MAQAKVLSPEVFNAVRKDVARYIKKKLKGMEIDVTDMELHNSSQTTHACGSTLRWAGPPT